MITSTSGIKYRLKHAVCFGLVPKELMRPWLAYFSDGDFSRRVMCERENGHIEPRKVGIDANFVLLPNIIRKN